MPRTIPSRFRMPLCAVAAACTLLAPVGASHAQLNGSDEAMRFANGLSEAFKRGAAAIEPSVVHITTRERIRRYGRDFFGRRVPLGDRVRRGLGSGVIIDESGLILTNNHVTRQGDVLTVRLYDGREYEAELLGADEATDIAVLRIDADGLQAAPLADSDAIEVGEWVLAIGSPFGLEQTVTAGIVSAKSRQLPGAEEGAMFQEFIQTDASINPGNSGGPLVTLEGKVVGINTAIVSASRQSAGLGFAVPANIARAVMESILDDGSIERAFLGVEMAELDPQVRRQLGLEPDEGVRITSVTAGTPADTAGIQPGDIVLTVNGREVIGGINRFRNLVALSEPGSRVNIVVLRDGERRTVTATLTDRRTFQRAMLGAEEIEPLGIVAIPNTPRRSRDLGYRRHVGGVIVFEIETGEKAAAAGMEPGDIILEVDGRPVDSPEDLRRRLNAARGEARIELLRRDLRGYVDIELD